MQVTRREIVDELLDFLGESNDSNARATANTLVNRVLQRLWLKHPWSAFVAPTPYELSSVANQRSYVLPTYFGRPQQNVAARNLTTGRIVNWRDANQILRDDPTYGTSLDVASEPEAYTVAGVAGVAVQPSSSGDALELVSSDANDTTVQVTIEGLDAAGVEQRSQVILTGTVAIAAGTWSPIEEFSKALPAGTDPVTAGTSSRGTVTLRKAAGGATLESLLPEESARQHTLLNLYPTPSGVWVFAIPYIRAPRKLRFDSDALPDFWGPMVQEELQIEWQVNRGDMTRAQADEAPRPDFLDMISHDNRSGRRPRVRPYHRP